MNKATDDAFAEGVLYAAGFMVAAHDEGSYAVEIVKEAGLEEFDCSRLDDTDKANLRLLADYGLTLPGL